jgi:predicted glutamine amidotransferase
MFMYYGDSVSELNALKDALIESAEHDKLGNGIQHSDGYGYVIITKSKTYYHRSTKPIYEDRFEIPEISGSFLAIFHARRASDALKGKPEFSHPFCESSGTSTIYLAHNGGVCKSRLSESLSIDGNDIVDSKLALELIIKEGGVTPESIEKLKDFTRKDSALNLFICSITGQKVEGYYYNYYPNPENRDYYELYTANMEKGKAVFSSTLKECNLGKCEIAKAKNDELVKFSEFTLEPKIEVPPVKTEKPQEK